MIMQITYYLKHCNFVSIVKSANVGTPTIVFIF